MIAAVFTPHGGCPERCTFCDQNVSGGTPISPDEAARSIEEQLSGSVDNTNEIAFYGGTFTALSVDLQRRLLNAAISFIHAGKANSIRISTRPDKIDEAWMRELASRYFVRTVELGVQTFDQSSREILGRTHTNADVTTAVATLRECGIAVGIHLMVGCPGENLDEMERELFTLAPDFVRIHPLVVIEGTALEKAMLVGQYTPMTLEAAVDACAMLTKSFEARGIRVIRLGLQANELLSSKIVAGPWHPAFGDLVRARICRDAVDEALAGAQKAEVELQVAKNRVERARGPKSENIQWWTEKHELKGISVYAGDEHGETGVLRIRHASGASERRQVELTQSPRG